MELGITGCNNVIGSLVGGCSEVNSCNLRRSKAPLIELLTHIIGFISRCSFVPTAKCVDIIPRRFTCEGDLVRGKTNNLTILLMKFSFAPDKLSSKETVYERQSRGRPQLGTWKFGQWVEIEVVDGLCNRVLPLIVSSAWLWRILGNEITDNGNSKQSHDNLKADIVLEKAKEVARQSHGTLSGWVAHV